MKPLNLIVLFVFLLYPFTGLGSSVEIGLPSSNYKVCMNTKVKTLFVFKDDSLLKIGMEKFRLDGRQKISAPNEYYFETFIPVAFQNTVVFVEEKGGRVLKLVNDSIVRIDNSFSHKAQIRSTIFNYNDTIFRFGGYGYWSGRNFFTWFDMKSGQWEIVAPAGSSKFPPGIYDAVVQIIGDEWYVYGGRCLNPANPLVYEENHEVWVFHRNEKRWEKRGTTGSSFVAYLFRLEYENKTIFFREKDFEITNILENRTKRFLYDSKSNKITNAKGCQPFFYEGNFYGFGFVPAREPIEVIKIPGENINSTVAEKSKVYRNSKQLVLPVVLLLFVLLISGLMVNTIKKRKQVSQKIVISGFQLKYKTKKLELEDDLMQILRLLLSKEEVSLDEILQRVGNDNIHYSQNIRIKNQLIDQLNFKLKQLLNVQDNLVTERKSSIDKRMKVYFIDKELFSVNK